jgi:hypothetical protein
MTDKTAFSSGALLLDLGVSVCADNQPVRQGTWLFACFEIERLNKATVQTNTATSRKARDPAIGGSAKK